MFVLQYKDHLRYMGKLNAISRRRVRPPGMVRYFKSIHARYRFDTEVDAQAELESIEAYVADGLTQVRGALPRAPYADQKNRLEKSFEELINWQSKIHPYLRIVEVGLDFHYQNPGNRPLAKWMGPDDIRKISGKRAAVDHCFLCGLTMPHGYAFVWGTRYFICPHCMNDLGKQAASTVKNLEEEYPEIEEARNHALMNRL